ncbi:Manganese/iron superoxide dismutase [Kalaharituber pfeilii]|nr:Manganese/iron superoxide dismutase [Kalaharituber pfeilii]
MLGPASSALRQQGISALRAFAHAKRPTIRPSISTPSIAASTIPARSLHNVPELHRQEEFQNQGIPPLFTKNGFRLAWTEYQGSLVDKLNELVAGTQIENNTALDIAIMTSRRPEAAATFNYASQAHNNHFFFESLGQNKTPPGTPPVIPDALLSLILQTFGNLDTIKAEFLATALAIFGSGHVWLLLERNNRLRILTTYNSGTPYPAAHARRQDIDTNTMSMPNGYPAYPPGSYGDEILNSTQAAAAAAAGGTGPGGHYVWPAPLLNVSCWPHTYLPDYGVTLEGKKKYLENWWIAVDWNVVAARVPSKAYTGPREMFS